MVTSKAWPYGKHMQGGEENTPEISINRRNASFPRKTQTYERKLMNKNAIYTYTDGGDDNTMGTQGDDTQAYTKLEGTKDVVEDGVKWGECE